MINVSPIPNSIKEYKIIKPGVIEGYWNGEDTPFRITCPTQLQKALLYVLNSQKKSSIHIKKSFNADTRTAKNKISRRELIEQTEQHQSDVNQAIDFFRSELRLKGEWHDWTKIIYMDDFFNNFKYLQDGNKGNFTKMNWYKYHIATERHHIKARCPKDVDLCDILEHIADIVMAGLARSRKIYDEEIGSKLLQRAYKNTIKKLKAATTIQGEER